MTKRTIANIIGLAGSACLGIGLFIVLRDASCSMSASQSSTCQGVSDAGWWLMPLGLAVAILAAFGASPIVFASLFAAVSVGALAVAVVLPGETGPTPIVLGGIFGLVVLGMVVVKIAIGRRHARAAQIINDGTPGLATVLSVTDTGVTINNNPRVKLHVQIEPQDGSPSFEASKAITAPRVSIPTPGTVYPVWFMPSDPHTFVLGVPDGVGPGPGTDPRIVSLLQRAERSNTGRVRGFTGGTGSTEPPRAGGGNVDHTIARLGELHALLTSGALTQEEFDRQKARLLGDD